MCDLKIKWVASILSMLILMTIPVHADTNGVMKNNFTEQSIVQPYFTNISLFQNVFDISADGKASISVYLTAQNVDSVKVDAILQQYKSGSWTTIKSWTNTSIGTYSGLSGTYYITKGFNYRLVSYGTVYRLNNTIEKTTFTSDSKYY